MGYDGSDVRIVELEKEVYWWRVLSLIFGLTWVAFAVLWWLV